MIFPPVYVQYSIFSSNPIGPSRPVYFQALYTVQCTTNHRWTIPLKKSTFQRSTNLDDCPSSLVTPFQIPLVYSTFNLCTTLPVGLQYILKKSTFQRSTNLHGLSL